MKKTLTAIALLAAAVSGYSQGAIEFVGDIQNHFAQQIFTAQPNGNTIVSYGG
jgi:hypothetical protein